MAKKYFKETICKKCGNRELLDHRTVWHREKRGTGKCQKCITPENGMKNRFFGGQDAWNKGLPKEMQPGYGKHHEGMWGEDNPEWRGDNCSHEAHHQWLYRKLGKARKCEYCGFEGKCTWANLKNHEYHKDINDYISLCYSCHKLYDLEKIKL